jgi:hypothetical protein
VDVARVAVDRTVAVRGRAVVDRTDLVVVRGRAVVARTDLARDFVARFGALALALATDFVAVFLASGLSVARLMVLFAEVRLAAGFRAAEAATVRRLTAAFFGAVLVLLAVVGFSVPSSMAFIAVWIDLIPFIAVRLLAYATDLAIAAPLPAIMSKLYLLPRLRSTNLAGIAASFMTVSAGGRT